MTIIGIESLVYGVSDIGKSANFFEDFGLMRDKAVDPDSASFTLPEGSRVVIKDRSDPGLSHSRVEGDGVHEVIWGVRDAASCDRLARSLSVDRDLNVDFDGAVHFLSDFGVAMGLRVFNRIPVVSAPDALNSPGNVNRMNLPRRWRERARPKVISHAVFATPDVEKGFVFMRDRLDFRLSDSQGAFGKYMRAPGSNAHHSLFLVNADLPGPGMDGKLRFHHANFGVDDIDEIMTGANFMTRKGWAPSHWGLGRHRVDSGLFYYLPCPAGGEAEYGADADVIDDSWIPREWVNPLFGVVSHVHNLPPFLQEPPSWNFRYLTTVAGLADEAAH